MAMQTIRAALAGGLLAFLAACGGGGDEAAAPPPRAGRPPWAPQAAPSPAPMA